MDSIGKYQLLRRLGCGGFGEVFLALDPTIERQVAIKVFAPKDANLVAVATSDSQEGPKKLQERFLNEAKILASLEHEPYIINVIELGHLEDGSPWYAMPYLPKSLKDLLGQDVFDSRAQEELPLSERPRALPLEETWPLLQQILQGMQTAHQKGLVHRDLKPANILLTDTHQVRICDFGIAKAPDSQHSTVSNLGMGSRNYMAPEQRESAKHVDARADVYALGVLAYRMLTGRLPQGRFADPQVHQPTLSNALNQWVLTALQEQADQRFTDATAMLSALQKALAESPSTASDATGTFVAGTGSTLKSELKPLQQKITELFKAEGVIDSTQLKALSVAADIAGVSEAELTQLIAETKAAQPAVVHSFIKWREKVESSKSQHQGNVPIDEREALLAGGVLLGKTEMELARFLPVAASGKTTASAQKSSQGTSNHSEPKKPNKGLLAAGIATILLAGGGYYGYSSYQQIEAERSKDSSAWQQAKLGDTVDAYQQYLNQIPEGQYRQSAAKALEQLKEAQLAAEKLAEAQQQLALTAQQNATQQAQLWLSKLGYELTVTGELDARSKAAIEKFESSEQILITGAVDETLLTKLEQAYWRNDQQAFEKAKVAHTEQSYQQYLDARADGKFRTQATQGIETVKQQLKEKAIAAAKAKADAEEKVHLHALADAKAKADAEEKVRLQALVDAKAKAETEEKARKEKAEIPKKVLASLGRLVTIQAGSFMMGCSNGDSECYEYEKPRHQVTIQSFKLMETEVTFAMWDACVQAGGCSHQPDDENWGRSNRPVINVSFDDITQQFIPWLTKTTGQRFRLPTEAEWEYAARGGTTTRYSWGDSIHCGQARYGRREDGGQCSSSYDGTVPVKFFTANGYGLYDMSGNVWEWTQDCWNDSYKGAPTNGSASQQGDCAKRVVRGGSWGDGPADLRVSFRNWDDSRFRFYYFGFGFRLAQDL